VEERQQRISTEIDVSFLSIYKKIDHQIMIFHQNKGCVKMNCDVNE